MKRDIVNKSNYLISLVKAILESKYTFYFLAYVFFVIIAINTPLVADDFSFSLINNTNIRIKSLTDIVNSVADYYLNWNGRVLGYGLTELCLLGNNHIVYTLVYPIINIFVIELIYRLIGVKSTFYYYLVMCFLLSAHVLVLNQTMFWIIGWNIYVVGLIPLLYIIYYFKNIVNKRKEFSVWKTTVFAYIGCLFVEHYSIIILAFSILAIIYNIKNKRDNKYSIIICIASILGCLTVFFAPGLSARASSEAIEFNGFFDMIHFGWSRFIYCYFFLNQRIFFLLASAVVVYSYKYINKTKYIIISVMIPIIVLSLILIFNPYILGSTVCECLTGEWSYYTCEVKNLLIYSVIVLYYIFSFFYCILQVCRKENNLFLFYIYLSAVASSLCFITSNLACERTQFISYILLMITVLMLTTSILTRKLAYVLVVLTMIVLIYNSNKYISNYKKEYMIYKYNEQAYMECQKNHLNSCFIKEHNYRYIFKSDLNFDIQDSWLFNSIRCFYQLDENVIIQPLDNN